jgi:hypothetical protein
MSLHHTSGPFLRAFRRKPGYREAVNPSDGAYLFMCIQDRLPTYAEKYLEPAFKDYEPMAAGLLITAAPNELRGLIALCAY